MAGNNLVFYGTTGPSGTADGQSQPDTTKWLGRFRASQTLHELQSTLTANQSTQQRHVIVDSARIGDGAQAHRLKWILIQTGTNALSAARVASFDDSTGEFKLDRRLGPGNAAIGDAYAIFPVNNVWPDVSAAQGQAGETRYRAIALRNEHGSSITNIRFYFQPLMIASEFARLHQTANSGAWLQRDDDQTDILDSLGQRDPLGGPDNFGGSGGWVSPFGYGTADTNVGSLPNTTSIGIWLRRVIAPGTRARASVAVLIVAETDVTGSNPDPLAGGAIMAYDILGTNPSATIEPDNFLHVAGGSRLRGLISRAGAPIVGKPARWTIIPGDPGNIFTDDDPLTGFDTTDAAGEVQATITIPDLESLAGDFSTPRLIVGAGDEVGEPRPRLQAVASGQLSMTTSGTAHVAQSEQQFDVEPGPGFFMGL